MTITGRSRPRLARRLSAGLLVVVGMVLGTFVMVNVHEIGHTLAARLTGDPSASYVLYRTYRHGGRCIGCNQVHQRALGAVGWVIVPLAGMAATQLVTWTAWMLGAGRRLPSAALLTPFALDLPSQLVQVLSGSLVEERVNGVDVAALVTHLGWAQGGRAVTVRAGIAVVLVAYLLLWTWLLRRRRAARSSTDHASTLTAG